MHNDKWRHDGCFRARELRGTVTDKPNLLSGMTLVKRPSPEASRCGAMGLTSSAPATGGSSPAGRIRCRYTVAFSRSALTRFRARVSSNAFAVSCVGRTGTSFASRYTLYETTTWSYELRPIAISDR